MTRLTITAALCVLLNASLATDYIARTWTDRKGRTVEAEYLSFEDGKVRIKRESDNKIFAIPLDQLSDADKAFVKSKNNGAEERTEQHPCTLKLLQIKITDGTALATLQFEWSKQTSDLPKGDMTVVVLFQPKLVAPLKPELMALSRDYSFNLPNDNLMKMTSGLTIKDDKGTSYNGALILFFTSADSKIDFRKSGKQTIPIRIQNENRVTGQPAVTGSGVVSFGLFKEDDPKLDQLKSTKYKQLSNVASQAVELK